MSLFNDALNLVKTVAPLFGPQGAALAAGLNLFQKVVDFVAPIVRSLVNSAPLPDDAKSVFNNAYALGFGR